LGGVLEVSEKTGGCGSVGGLGRNLRWLPISYQGNYRAGSHSLMWCVSQILRDGEQAQTMQDASFGP
jgi:hypothetical protein